MTRRCCLGCLAAMARMAALDPPTVDSPKDWVCPMDPDVRSASPGVCPRCGMKLVPGVPDRKEFSLDIAQSPELLKPGAKAVLTLRAIDPERNAPVQKFEIVHEKLIHLFVVGEDLEFFAHIHPTLEDDGSFRQEITFPNSGMYRLLADFYPSGSVPQLAMGTIFVPGPPRAAHLTPELAPCRGSNLTATLTIDPGKPLAGLETRLTFALAPAEDLELYLGAWAHMLAASADLVDLLHLHPFLADGRGQMQFNVIFPRPGLYRIWTQFQRAGQVNTTVFTVPVQAL